MFPYLDSHQPVVSHQEVEPVEIVVEVIGPDLDLATAPRLERQLQDMIIQHPRAEIVVDLSDVAFMDCAGLRPLLQARNRVGDRLTLRGPAPRILRLLDLADVYDSFRIQPCPARPSQRRPRRAARRWTPDQP